MRAKNPDAVLVSGAQGLPDLNRGNQERLGGRLDDAVRDLLPLAERGYPDAQIYLAATYLQRDTLDGEHAALRWYRAALGQRPELDVVIARLLINSNDRALAIEGLALIRHAQKDRDDPLVRSSLLAAYSLFPDLDDRHEAAALAESASRSSLPDDRVAAIGWYRININNRDHAAKLETLCRSNLDIEAACYVDLAHFLRYRGDRPGLDALVKKALAAFERGQPPPEPTDLYHLPIALAPIAASLATAMVDQPEIEDIDEVYETFKTQAEYDAAAQEETEDGTDLPQIQTTVAPAENANAEPAPPANAMLDLADQVLRWMLEQPGEFPAEAAGVGVRYPYLLRDVDVAALLNKAAENGQHEARLLLGEMYLFGRRVPLDAWRAENNLLAAVAFRSTRDQAHYRLGRLYQGGFLGTPSPQKSVDNYLAAARSGSGHAYLRLAQIYLNSPGFRINRTNSYVFARRAEDSGRPAVIRTRVIPRALPANAPPPASGTPAAVEVAYKLLDRLRVDLSENELKKAESLYEAERKIRPALFPPLSADVYNRPTQ